LSLFSTDATEPKKLTLINFTPPYVVPPNIRMIQKGQILAQKASQFAFSNFAALMA
jgi:hypothetical protein